MNQIIREIDTSSKVSRPTIQEMDDLLGHAFPILDHGFVRVMDYMGDDGSVVQAARVSYGAGTTKKSRDAQLIDYLMRHWHTTPFEMCELKLHVKLPVFVARQWIRHRTASINEMSARYSILNKEFYFPRIEDMNSQSKVNNQGRGEILDPEDAQEALGLIRDDAVDAYSLYELLLAEPTPENEEDKGGFGLARELSRMVLPMNAYTEFYWKTDLHNLLHFLRLRVDLHAQYEIRVYAEFIERVVAAWVPQTYTAWVMHRKDAITLSVKQQSMFASLLVNPESQALIEAYKNFDPDDLVIKMGGSYSKGEWAEFLKNLDLIQTNAQRLLSKA